MVVATLAVPANGTVVQQWIWEAVVVPVKPLKLTCTRIVFAAKSKVTVAEPVPREVLGGLSLGPDRFATKVTGTAWALAGRARKIPYMRSWRNLRMWSSAGSCSPAEH